MFRTCLLNDLQTAHLCHLAKIFLLTTNLSAKEIPGCLHPFFFVELFYIFKAIFFSTEFHSNFSVCYWRRFAERQHLVNSKKPLADNKQGNVNSSETFTLLEHDIIYSLLKISLQGKADYLSAVIHTDSVFCYKGLVSAVWAYVVRELFWCHFRFCMISTKTLLQGVCVLQAVCWASPAGHCVHSCSTAMWLELRAALWADARQHFWQEHHYCAIVMWMC